MLHSVRARLAAWYAGVFACFLGIFAVGIYSFFSRSTLLRIDEFLAETGAAVAGAIEFERANGVSDSAAVEVVLREVRLRAIDVMIFDRRRGTALSGHTFVQPGTTASRVIVAPTLPDLAAVLRSAPGAPTLRSVRTDSSLVRVYTLPYALGRNQLVIGTAQSLRSWQRVLNEAELALAVGLPLMLLLATVGGYLLARKSLAPVVLMGDRAAAIGAANLHERLPVANPHDELGHLAGVLNGLLERVERSLEQQRAFTADASHELRTPVAIISGESELALSRPDRTVGDLRDSLATVRDESRRLRDVVEDLFLLARVDAGERPLRPTAWYLRDVLEECVRAARPLVEARPLELRCDLPVDDLPITADETLVRRLIMILLDNAIKYTAQGHVTLRASHASSGYAVEVDDTGPGIGPEDQPRVFDRFYRARLVPPGTPTGAGLGLAIGQWIAKAHGGSLVLAKSDELGSVFRATLPAL